LHLREFDRYMDMQQKMMLNEVVQLYYTIPLGKTSIGKNLNSE
jgi:hypothetical protein